MVLDGGRAGVREDAVEVVGEELMGEVAPRPSSVSAIAILALTMAR